MDITELSSVPAEHYGLWIATVRNLLDEGIKNGELGPRGSDDPLVRRLEDYIQYFLGRSTAQPRISRVHKFIFKPLANVLKRKAKKSSQDSLDRFYRMNKGQSGARQRYTALVELAYYKMVPRILQAVSPDYIWPEEQQLSKDTNTAYRKEVRIYLIPMAVTALAVVQQFRSISGTDEGISEMMDGLQAHVLDVAENALRVPQDYTMQQLYIIQCDLCVQVFLRIIDDPASFSPLRLGDGMRNAIYALDELRREFEHAKQVQRIRLRSALDQILPPDLQNPETLTPIRVLCTITDYMQARVYDHDQCRPIRDRSAFGFGGFGFAEAAELTGVGKVIVKRIQIRQWSLPHWKFYARILREIRAMLSTNHRHILPLLGICLPEDDKLDCPGLVLPFCEDGDLRNFLYNKPRTPTSVRLQLISDVASGLEYLHNHNPRIVHGDIKGDNILIRFWNDPDSMRYEACLCDFGISRVLDGFTQWSSGIIHGNRRWLAPELVARKYSGSNEEMTPETDMYSFGCVFLEGMTGSIPYPELSNDDVAGAQKMTPPHTPDYHLPQVPAVPHQYLDFMKQCWHLEPTFRPSAREAVQALWGFISALELK